MKLSVDMDGLTWGDLCAFVDAARGAGIDEALPVEQVFAEQDDTLLVAIQVEIADPRRRVAVFDHDDRFSYAEILGGVLDSQGDARSALGPLKELRDAMLEG